jgi:hypothetical protein
LLRDSAVQLILACLPAHDTSERIRSLVESEPDWHQILAITEKAGVAPIVYEGLRETTPAVAVPDAAMQQLRRLYRQASVHGILLRHVLSQALGRLSDAEIPVVVLKDPVLATSCYPSATRRPLRRIDLLVRAHDMDRARRMLRDLSPVALELHDQVLDVQDATEGFFGRARPAEIETVATLVCSNADLLLQLATELGRGLSELDPSAQVAAICDIAAVCRASARSEDLDWPRFVAQAHAYVLGAVAYAGLHVVHELAGIEIPAEPWATLRPTPPRTQSRRSPGEVGVTYDNSSTDGVGSQLQRIYGLYALSRGLHVKYVHTPLGRIGYQGLMPLLSGQTEPDFAARYNAAFTLPSDDFDVEASEHIRIHTLTPRIVERYRQRASDTGQSVLLSTCIPFPYTDNAPTSWLVVRSVSPYRHHQPSGPLRVCVHLRRGDNSISGRSDHGDRLLSNDFYLRVCWTLAGALGRLGAPYVIRMHTEVPPRAYTLYPGDPGLYFQLDRPGSIDPATYALADFAALPNLEIVTNVDALQVLDDFATADVLVLSRSSLGYVAGLLNPHGLVVWAPWWHPPLPDWLVADEHGNLDEADVTARLATLIARRQC